MLIKIERVIIGMSCCNRIVSHVISKIFKNNLNRFNDTIHKNHKTTSTLMITKIEVTTSHVCTNYGRATTLGISIPAMGF